MKEEKTYHFIAGLPRSGSTLLANILLQNPRFHATATSGVVDLMTGIRNAWDNIIEFQTCRNEEAKKRVIKGILDSFYKDIKKPIIFDKSRGWLPVIEMLENVLEHKVKILVPVRDVRDVLASFEKLWRKNSTTKQIAQEKNNYIKFQTLEGRCSVWFSADQPLGIAYNRIVDALKRGLSDRLILVDFNDLTNNPKTVMENIYKFLGEEYFEHNFDNVEQITKEDDFFHGINGLHDIRTKAEPMKPQWPTILGREFEGYSKYNFWDQGILNKSNDKLII